MAIDAVAGVAEQPQASNIKGCDGLTAQNRPAESAGNPSACRTRADPFIIEQLAQVRRLNKRFPPPRRGLMYFDFDANRIAIAGVRA